MKLHRVSCFFHPSRYPYLLRDNSTLNNIISTTFWEKNKRAVQKQRNTETAAPPPLLSNCPALWPSAPLGPCTWNLRPKPRFPVTFDERAASAGAGRFAAAATRQAVAAGGPQGPAEEAAVGAAHSLQPPGGPQPALHPPPRHSPTHPPASHPTPAPPAARGPGGARRRLGRWPAHGGGQAAPPFPRGRPTPAPSPPPGPARQLAGPRLPDPPRERGGRCRSGCLPADRPYRGAARAPPRHGCRPGSTGRFLPGEAAAEGGRLSGLQTPARPAPLLGAEASLPSAFPPLGWALRERAAGRAEQRVPASRCRLGQAPPAREGAPARTEVRLNSHLTRAPSWNGCFEASAEPRLQLKLELSYSVCPFRRSTAAAAGSAGRPPLPASLTTPPTLPGQP